MFTKFLYVFIVLSMINTNINADWRCENKYDSFEDSNMNICQALVINESGENNSEQLILRSIGNSLDVILYLDINAERIDEIDVRFDKTIKRKYSVTPSSDHRAIFVNDVISFGKNVLDNNKIYVRYLSDDNFLKTIQFDISKLESKKSTQLTKKIIQLDNEQNEQIKRMQSIKEQFISQHEEYTKKSEVVHNISDAYIGNGKKKSGNVSGTGMILRDAKFVQP